MSKLTLGGRHRQRPETHDAGPWHPNEWFAGTLLAVLTAAMLLCMRPTTWRSPTRTGDRSTALRSADSLRETGDGAQTILFAALWAVGVAQQYRLLDWVDERNFYIKLDVHERGADGASRPGEPRRLMAAGTRSVLAISYAVGITWASVPETHIGTLRQALHRRLARRYCVGAQGSTQVVVDVIGTRVDPARPEPARRDPWMRFKCTEGVVQEQKMFLDF